ncbi:DUF86 domain-containing protein [Candidatus Falkowbacteria bacterium]|nr:DUF86 domain-containing protein [Candidatus Falkowbacteria bacterium]
MIKDAKIFLKHILESIEFIEDYTKGLSEADFYNLMEKIDAVVKRLEIIGEAANNLPLDFRALNSHLPWQDMIDMRNLLIHEYFGVNKEIVWKTIKEDLPPLKEEIERLLK